MLLPAVFNLILKGRAREGGLGHQEGFSPPETGSESRQVEAPSRYWTTAAHPGCSRSCLGCWDRLQEQDPRAAGVGVLEGPELFLSALGPDLAVQRGPFGDHWSLGSE